MDNLILYIICLFLGGAGAWLISRWGKALGLLDNPNERSSHKGLVSKGGGIGILAAFVLPSLLLNIPSGFWLPATFLALVSFYGDRSELSLRFRLPVQFAATLVFLSTGLFCDSSLAPPFLTFFLSPLNSILWILFLSLFIVGTTNFYNFMDGINGIAAITGIVGFGLLSLSCFLSRGDNSFAVLSICICLSCLGFLPFNMPKAKVFIGDVGSILLGFVFAGVVVVLSKGFLDFVFLAAFLFPFYADELTTMAVRIKDDENLMRPHRRHLYQLFANELGIPHWKVSGMYGVLQLAVGVSILLVKDMGSIAVISMLAIYFCGFAGMGFAVRRKLE